MSQFRKRERNKLETKSAGKALEEPTGAPRERSRIRLQRNEAAEGRGYKYKHDIYRKPRAAEAKPRDTRSPSISGGRVPQVQPGNRPIS